MKKMEKYTPSDTAILNKAIKALRRHEIDEDEPFVVLVEKVSEIARKGAKKEVSWRHLTLRYFPEVGKFYFKVTNPLTGTTRDYRTKDFVGKTGKMKWRTLASAIKNT